MEETMELLTWPQQRVQRLDKTRDRGASPKQQPPDVVELQKFLQQLQHSYSVASCRGQAVAKLEENDLERTG